MHIKEFKFEKIRKALPLSTMQVKEEIAVELNS
jgi:hypothetical protein